MTRDPHRDQPVLTAGRKLSEAAGAIILVHGRGASAADILQLRDELGYPELAYFAPQADENTWYFSRVCGTFKERSGWHGCQMPEQLLGRIIRACSDPGDVVLDPFCGIGTALFEAAAEGRSWIGIERHSVYAQRAQEAGVGGGGAGLDVLDERGAGDGAVGLPKLRAVGVVV